MSQYRYQQLAKHLQDQIHSGFLTAEEKLPSIRTLAAGHQVSKITVQHALQSLEAKGLIVAKDRSGYFVSAGNNGHIPDSPKQNITAPKIIDVPYMLQEVMSRSAVFDIAPQASQDDHLSPYLAKLNASLSRALKRQPVKKAMYYSEPSGEPELKQAISVQYRKRQFHAPVEQICITSGCQNALFMALMAVCQPGDIVAIESPGFYGVLQLIEQLKLQVVELPVSYHRGLRASMLEEAAQKWPIKAVILTPHYATPTGSVIPTDEQQAIDEVAAEHDIVVIEDDIYGDLGFFQHHYPFASRAQKAKTILCGSLSKSLSRDLRIGWAISKHFIKPINHLKIVNQLASSQASQLGLAEFLQQGFYDRHLLWFRKRLLQQKDQLINFIQLHWPKGIKFTNPEGGICIWVELPENVNTFDLYSVAIAHDLVVTPGRLFTAEALFDNYLRLSFLNSLMG